jgi:hypothetical protein
MAYEERRLARQKIRYNNANDELPLVYQMVVDGAKVTPDSATIAIYKPGSTTAVQAAAAMTVSGTLLTYIEDTTTVADYPVDQGYRGDIVVTYDSKTWERHIIFDVATYVFIPNVGFDQIVALDDGIRGMAHDGDEDFSPLLEACRDDLQLMIESKIQGSGRLLEEHVLDPSRMAIPFRHYVLHRIWANKGNTDKRDMYAESFDMLFEAATGSLQIDAGQDGQEDQSVGGDVGQVQLMR